MALFSFLQNRQARVRLHDELSSSKTFHQGLPQGCVLSPLLFIFFINNLAELLISEDPDKAAKLRFSLFADDVTGTSYPPISRGSRCCRTMGSQRNPRLEPRMETKSECQQEQGQLLLDMVSRGKMETIPTDRWK